MKNSTTRKRAATKKRAQTEKPQPPLTPTVNYNEFLRELCRRFDERGSNGKKVPSNDVAHLDLLVEARREQLDAYLALGNLFADALENPDTSSEAYHALSEEMLELGNDAKIFLDDPIILRLLYPLARYRTLHSFKSFEAKGGARQ